MLFPWQSKFRHNSCVFYLISDINEKQYVKSSLCSGNQRGPSIWGGGASYVSGKKMLFPSWHPWHCQGNQSEEGYQHCQPFILFNATEDSLETWHVEKAKCAEFSNLVFFAMFHPALLRRCMKLMTQSRAFNRGWEMQKIHSRHWCTPKPTWNMT